ncbi:methyltransferase FkbM [uncultured Helicobacter sp.]|uniref:methyltransferase FkbM n=1 Tax=uncultured Helicobacter sp. TaxID=175537 RepID=UPI00374E2CF4
MLLSFNRLDTVRQILAQIARVQPPRIYLASDGAREGKINAQGIAESTLVQEVREFLLDSIDWDCAVHTRFLDSNLGCKAAVSSAISWFFSYEEQGIILEDDCLPTLSFFRFCDELLARYKEQERVMMISGWSALDFAPNPSVETLCPKARLSEDYFFSKYNHIWGWASWARAWAKYELESSDFVSDFARFAFSSTSERRSWRRTFGAYYAGKIDTWDYPWTFSIWKSRGLCVYPKNNMIQNIGFNRQDAAHTQGDSKFARMPSYDLIFPLTHPRHIAPNPALDSLNFSLVFEMPSLLRRVVRKIQKILKSLSPRH